MLEGISKLLTGDILKAICDMGHGDTLVIADAHYPAETKGKRVIRMPGVNASEVLEAILPLFPLDIAYTEHPICVMDLTDSDKKRGMKTPEAWDDFMNIVLKKYKGIELGKMERFDFYDRSEKAFVIIQTSEERQYGNLLLTKGCVLKK